MEKICRVLLTVMIIFTLSSVVHAEWYTYVDNQGAKYYTNVPPPNPKPEPKPKPKLKPKVTPTFSAMPVLTLEKVEHPENPKARYGPKAEFLTPGKYPLTHEDNVICIKWNKIVESMAFVLDNKTDQSMKILWDESVFIDVDGINHRIIHSGVKYSDRNSSQPPSVIARKGKSEDALVPSDNIELLGNSSQWHEKSLFPFPSRQIGGTIESFQKIVAPLTGKTFQVLLALEIEGVPNDYIFSFRIDRVITGELPK